MGWVKKNELTSHTSLTRHARDVIMESCRQRVASVTALSSIRLVSINRAPRYKLSLLLHILHAEIIAYSNGKPNENFL